MLELDGAKLLFLREAQPEIVLDIIKKAGESLTPKAAVQILRNPWISTEIIDQLLLTKGPIKQSNEVRALLAAHPKTQRLQALRLLTSLSWKQLLDISLNLKVSPPVRKTAELRLIDRLSTIALGEKVHLARKASPHLLEALLKFSQPRVISAFLENPRVNEAFVVKYVSVDRTPPECLEVVARSQKWGKRHRIRFALARNPRTITSTAMAQVTFLRKGEIRDLARDPRVPEPVRQRARLYMEEG